MAQNVAAALAEIGEIRTEWDARNSGEPWWNDWVRLRTLIETSRVPEARVLVKELAAKWPDVPAIRHYERALEPPKVRAVPRRSDYDPLPDYAWLREHGHEYAGSWLAVYKGRLVAADPDLKRVMEIADAEVGPSNALLARAPDRRRTE
jgi:hypothetical protein